jgi:hypothetical protein
MSSQFLTPWVSGWNGGGLMSMSNGQIPWGSSWGSESTAPVGTYPERNENISPTDQRGSGQTAERQQTTNNMGAMTPEQQARADAIKGQMRDYAVSGAIKGIANTGMGLLSGAPANVGNVAQSVVSGVANPSAAAGFMSNLVADQMGLSKPSGFWGGLANTAVTGLMGMFNPALGFAASVAGPMVTDAVMDFAGWRTNEKERDDLENQYGELAGRRAYGGAIESARKQAIADSLSMSPVAGLARAEALNAQNMNQNIEASLAPQLRSVIQDAIKASQAQSGLMGGRPTKGWSDTHFGSLSQNQGWAARQDARDALARQQDAAALAAAARTNAASRGGSSGGGGVNSSGARGSMGAGSDHGESKGRGMGGR